MAHELGGRRVTIMGLGHFGGGVAAARWLARQGAVVTVTDLADETTLADSLAALAKASRSPRCIWAAIARRISATPTWSSSIRRCGPAIRFVEDRPRAASVPLTSEIELFLGACPAPIVGVTGSNGKSTTAAMIAAILRADGRRTWLGGNLGGSLLDRPRRRSARTIGSCWS